MRMLGLVAASLLLAVAAYGWGGSYDDGCATRLVGVSEMRCSQQVGGKDLLPVRGREAATPRGETVDAISSFRRVLGGAPDARRYGDAALEFVGLVGRASGQERISAAGPGAGGGVGAAVPAAYEEGGVALDACPPAEFKRQALEAYGVGWAYEKMLRVEFCESTCIVDPCVVGRSGEEGPLQFLPSTWATTPYRDYSACSPIATWHAGAWMVSEGRWGEWSCWWLTP